jgi:DNA-binding MarR family transcriptional regulator
MDFVTGLGPAFVAHRLRRLSDRIVDEIAVAILEQGLTVPPRSGSTILLLAERGPMGPVDIARTLRFSHPLMVRALRVLEQLGLVSAIDDPGDQRRRLVELTARGRAEAAALERFNARLSRVIREVLDEGSGSADAFLEMLDTIARSLDRESLSTRLTMKVDS